MDELASAMKQARQHVHVDWTEERLELVLCAMHLRRRKRVRLAVSAGAGAVALVALAALVALGTISAGTRLGGGGQGGDHNHASRTVAPAPWSPAFTYADGSRASALDLDTELALVEQGPARVTTELRRGRASFVVQRNPGRQFRAVAGPLTVVVLGTSFTIERLSDGAWVSVQHGRVQVEWPGGVTALAEGERRLFRNVVAQAAPDPTPALAPAAAAGRRRSPPSPVAIRREAPTAVAAAPDPVLPVPSPVAPPAALPVPGAEVERLLGEADRERSAGRVEQAVNLLARVVREHSSDPRAALAAFTQGRLLLAALDRPREAAAQFARARALAPHGPLAADALAREAESWARAGAGEAARARALEYLRLYPDGGHAAEVTRYLTLP